MTRSAPSPALLDPSDAPSPLLPFPAPGAHVEGEGVRFRVWAPTALRVEVVIDHPGAPAGGRAHALARHPDGHHDGWVAGLGAGTRYRYRLDGGASYPDPAARALPDGVHGAAEVVDPSTFAWSDAAWPGVAADRLVIYELHVGTFTPEGTFDAAIGRLDHVAALGATAIELMPVAAFPGTRNWGYDGVALYAPAAPYGGPEGLRRLVDAAHARGLGVLLDVVYNHFGPEGNYLHPITGGRFFTDRHRTPWGDAIAYDGPDAAAVRGFVLHNALHWLREYHVDGLRLDATHAIRDASPVHLLTELAAAVRSLDAGRAHPRVLVAEDERNERRVVLPPADGGHGLDAVWADDLHHQLRRLAAGDREGYFASFGGTIADVVATLRRGWFWEGQPSEHHREPRGTPADGLPPSAFVHCLQNHDQVGNRAMGDRLHHAIAPDVYRALSALLCLSPYTPLLWMGQEWAASTPFQYFTDHPPELGRLVTEGRRAEFGHFSAFSDPAMRARIPDPQAEATFRASQLRWDEVARPPHDGVLALYRALLALRRGEPALAPHGRAHFAVAALGDGALALRRTAPGGEALLLALSVAGRLTLTPGAAPETRAPSGTIWRPVLATEETRFGGAGVALPAAVGDDTPLVLAGAGAVVLRATA